MTSTTTAPVRIAPSVLPADQGRLTEETRRVEDGGADLVQWDVMDGHFVPNLTFGPGVIAAARAATSLPFEAHLMVANPDRLLAEYVEAGCGRIIVHAETCIHLHSTLGRIRDLGAEAGVALNPATPLSTVEHVIDRLDLILVMTVNPGFSGQDYLATMEPKVASARRLLDQRGSSAALEVDGGVGPATIGGAAAAGADTFCAGSAVFGADDVAAAITELRSLAASAREEAATQAASEGAGRPTAERRRGRSAARPQPAGSGGQR